LSVSAARSPAASRAVPAAVIIAALSVQSRGGGMCSPDPVLRGLGEQRRAQRAVGGHAAGKHHPLHPDASARPHRLAHQHILTPVA